MIKITSGQLWEFVVPYVENLCKQTIERYVQEATEKFEKELRAVLQPQLGAISARLTESMDTFSKELHVQIELTGNEKAKKS